MTLPQTKSKLRATTNRPRPGVHYLIHFIWIQMVANNMTRKELAEKSGVPESSIKEWFYAGVNPQLKLIEACLGVFGYNYLKPTICEEKKDGHL
jgi:hypothetical protein